MALGVGEGLETGSAEEPFAEEMGLCELCWDSYSKHRERLRTKEKAQRQQQWDGRERGKDQELHRTLRTQEAKGAIKIHKERARSSTPTKLEQVKNQNLMNKATQGILNKTQADPGMAGGCFAFSFELER